VENGVRYNPREILSNMETVMIPIQVMKSKSLSVIAKLCYSVINDYSSKNKFYGGNRALALEIGVNEKAVSRAVKELLQSNIVRRKSYDPYEIKKILMEKHLYGAGVGEELCSWCGVKTIILVDHHFPIQKQFGGEETVEICPNCHQEYHILTTLLEGDQLCLSQQTNH
jgi:CRISPR/Cas system-associated protein Cas10 (large subunit of type III CRISPR-Cas system)